MCYAIKSLFILPFAIIFLGEILNPIKYLGIFLLLCGAIGLSVKNNFKLRNKKAFWLMIASTFFLAIYYVLTKYLLQFANYWVIFAYMRFSSFLFILPFVWIYLPELKRTTQLYGNKVLGFIIIGETLNFFALISLTAAMSYGLVSLVGAIGSTNSFFVLIFSLILSKFYPKILKEEIKKSAILLKAISIIFIIIGVILII